jgi:hypothetical protein
MRVGVYVDAFNVYYGGRDHCGRGVAGWRWLDLAALSASLIDPGLWPEARLERIVYCTAPRDRAGDPTSIVDQRTYVEALQSGPVPVVVLDGQYVPRVKAGDIVNSRGRRIASPGPAAVPRWLPAKEVMGPDGTPVLRASLTTFEEKGSDVNVASHLLIDVLDRQVDAAIVFSNDSDLRYPLEQARLRVPSRHRKPRQEAHCRGAAWFVGHRRRSSLVAPSRIRRLHKSPAPAGGRIGPPPYGMVSCCVPATSCAGVLRARNTTPYSRDLPPGSLGNEGPGLSFWPRPPEWDR